MVICINVCLLLIDELWFGIHGNLYVMSYKTKWMWPLDKEWCMFMIVSLLIIYCYELPWFEIGSKGIQSNPLQSYYLVDDVWC